MADVSLLAAPDISTWITLIFVILGFLGWIMNLAGSKNPPPPARSGRAPGAPPRPQPRNRDERIQSEIDIFLQEVGAKKRPSEPKPVEADEPTRTRAPLRREPFARTTAEAEAPVAPVLPAAEPERQRLAPSQLGSAVREHVSQHLQGARLEQHVKQQLETVVERAVEHHIGARDRTDRQSAFGKDDSERAPTPEHSMIQTLRSPAGMRQAMILSEILGPPPSLR